MTAHSHSPKTALDSHWRGLAPPGRWFSGLLGVLAIQAVLAIPAPANAAIFKCVSATGDTTYTSTPCAHDESTRRISSSAAAVAGLDCRIARKLSYDTTRRMKQGETSAAVYDSHGGMDSLSPLVIGLISYIYTFDGNDNVSASRIATLATQRCEVGSFGANARRCEVYPVDFLQKLGGCEAARDDTDNSGKDGAFEQTRAQPTPDTVPDKGAAIPASYLPPSTAPVSAAATVASATDKDRVSCRQRIGQTIENTNGLLQEGASTSEQESLRALQRQLRMQLARC